MTETSPEKDGKVTSQSISAGVRSDAAYLGILEKLRSMGVPVEHEADEWNRRGESSASANVAVGSLGPLHCILLGDPSSGKSYVVEAISGIAFPRGDGTHVVTETRMRKGLPRSNFAARVYTTAGTSASQQDFAANLVVVVEVTSPDVPDLTIVDVPGFDEFEGLDFINSLLEGSDGVILAVLSVTQDVTCSSAFERIQKIDPTGRRTIGVLTKPDLYGDPKKTAISSLLAGAFSLGCVMILGRSQKDIDDGVRIDEAKDQEIAFFDAHPELRTVTDDVLVGSDDLIALLSRVSQLRRRRALHKIKEDVRQAMSSASMKLAALGTTGRYPHPVFKNSDLLLGARANTLSDAFEATVNAHLSRRQLPGFGNSGLFGYRVARYVELWMDGAANLSESVRGLVAAVARTLLQEFGSHVPGFVDDVLPLVDDVARGLAEEPWQRIAASFKSERRPFSRNSTFPDAVERIIRAKTSNSYGKYGPNAYVHLLAPTILTAFEDAATKDKALETIHNQLPSSAEPSGSEMPAGADADAKPDSLKKEIISKVLDELQNVYKTGVNANIQTYSRIDSTPAILRPPLRRRSRTSRPRSRPSKGSSIGSAPLSALSSAPKPPPLRRQRHRPRHHVHPPWLRDPARLKVQGLLSDDASVLAISEEDTAFKRRRELLHDKIKELVAVREELAATELDAV
ncbi:P-loop containing nucleoside triphosphate hydrolase protein [Blyttiomyces helicus]|uniref:P-loop containing nucleoside triphosphate hydrolase protein n=1 Tax=Blyttiomyces helicus TaxID=388810 RepID=A0A4P9WEP6_9FUNG|nr:P-loop containing nucleoside triphosphate hydrolase protein [Blyttiomyces helicus]|eukprot:RKO91201.1 P-loop containing nucleoside triphosphate hydrolase protein [Blyttiomyces helicus]